MDRKKQKRKKKGPKAEKRPDFMVVNGADWKATLTSLYTYIIVSVDPGEVNLGFRIERRTRLNIGSSYAHVETLVMERLEFSYQYGVNSCPTFQNILTFLDSYSNYYPHVSLYLIEQQQIPDAFKIIKIAQLISTYYILTSRLYSGAVVAEVGPKAKTKYLKAPPKMGRDGTVAWGRNEGLKFLSLSKDLYGMNRVHTYAEKADDILVTVIQVEAIFRHLGLPITPDVNLGEGFTVVS